MSSYGGIESILDFFLTLKVDTFVTLERARYFHLDPSFGVVLGFWSLQVSLFLSPWRTAVLFDILINIAFPLLNQEPRTETREEE